MQPLQQNMDPATQAALAQFLQGSATSQSTAPLIAQAATTQVNSQKKGKPLTLGNIAHSLTRPLDPKSYGSASAFEDNILKDQFGVPELEHSLGQKNTTATTFKPIMFQNQAPTLYWGNALK